jgi:nucleotide-binding universal stress UspA family protein
MFRHCLVPLDGSALAECVLPHVIAFARAFKSEVTLLRVLAAPPPGAPVDVFDWQLQKAGAAAYLDEIATRLQTAGLPVDTVVTEGQPAASVIDYAHHHQVDLVAMSSHGASGLTDWCIGGVVQKVLFGSYLSTLLVRACRPIQTKQTDLRYQRILVPLDGSQRAEHVLSFASTLAQHDGAQLLLAHVLRHPEIPHHIPISAEDQRLAARLVAHNCATMTRHLEHWQSQLPVETEIHVLESEDVAARLHRLALSEEVDLVILSAHGYAGGNYWPYGSVATNFMVYGVTPLLLIQDLSPADRMLTPAEIVLQAQREHLFMASERFEPARVYTDSL